MEWCAGVCVHACASNGMQFCKVQITLMRTSSFSMLSPVGEKQKETKATVFPTG